MCPSCNANTRVAETRAVDGGRALRRRRHCPSCGHRITTFERSESPPPTVRKRGGHAERFDRVKLRTALLGAAHKRPVSAPDVERIVEGIEAGAVAGGGEIASERIVELCLTALRELDSGAFLQYAGTLPEFNPEITASLASGSVRGARDPSLLPAEPTVKGEIDV
ncbi:MAG: ATP cone domain-containing protein [Solirubrobacterales bacterium]